MSSIIHQQILKLTSNRKKHDGNFLKEIYWVATWKRDALNCYFRLRLSNIQIESSNESVWQITEATALVHVPNWCRRSSKKAPRYLIYMHNVMTQVISLDWIIYSDAITFVWINDVLSSMMENENEWNYSQCSKESRELFVRELSSERVKVFFHVEGKTIFICAKRRKL